MAWFKNEEEETEIYSSIFCPHCRAKIEGLIFSKTKDQDDSEIDIFGCSKCKKFLGLQE